MDGGSKLLDFPEYLFLQLMEWLTIDEFSLLDRSLCCHDKRDLILNYISLSTIHSPLTHLYPRHRYPFLEENVPTASYWFWLQTRKIYFKDIKLQSMKEASLFTKLYIYSLTKESGDILGKSMKEFTISFGYSDVNSGSIRLSMDSILMTVKIFNSLESFSCLSCPISDNMLTSIISYSKKLKSILLSNLPQITDVGLSSSLAACQSTIQTLTITNCRGIFGTNISPKLLSNLSCFNYNGDRFRHNGHSLLDLPSMALGLIGLKSLSLGGGMENFFTNQYIRETLLHLSTITSLEISHTSFFTGANLHDVISPRLQELKLIVCYDITYEGLCAILSNNLTNLIFLAFNALLEVDTDDTEGRCLPSLPRSLVTLQLTEMSTFTDKELNELFSSNLPSLNYLEWDNMDMVTGNDFTFHLPSSLCSIYISLWEFTHAGLKQLLSNKSQNNLTEMTISCMKITGEGLVNILPQHLKSLNFNHSGLTSKGLCDILSNDLPDLNNLDLSNCKIIDCGESFRFSTSNLTRLVLDNNHGMTEDGLYHLFLHNNLMNLTFLRLRNLPIITNLELQPSLPQSLTTLDIFGNNNLTDLGLKQLLSNNLINLHTLDASGCETITCQGLTGVLPPNLQYLNLIRCKSLTCKGLYDLLVNNSSSLKEIITYGSGVHKRNEPFSEIPGIVKFILSITAPSAILLG